MASMRVARYPAPRVLLVEAHPDTWELYGLWLTESGFHVTVAGSAEDALTAARSDHPDVVVAELMVPGGGVPMVQAMRAEPALDGALLIVLTTQAGPAMRQAALAAGADAFVVKPCGAARLCGCLLAASRDRLARPMAMDGAGASARRLAADLFAAVAERVDGEVGRSVPSAGH
jgi:two-component system alkaline phosphatase synthesis response regulator PhoP